ncbi:MAG: protein-L-isoaspartate(D-aspartate) O-methyltransferase [Phycisphaerales bacterium]|nr:MAG: protein-L-isoaspartate(D-aspartate) O-methyltransferase [Phycisphaerales bacterium]
MTDTSDHTDEFSRLRAHMVDEQIRARGVRDERLLRAMMDVPRERFVLSGRVADAYADRALPIADDQTISQPYIVAYMTAQLEPAPHCRVLEIGTGSGYQTAILSLLCEKVYTVERLASLAVEAKERLMEMGYENIAYHVGDGSAGWPEYAPYDRIMVTAGTPDVPAPLVDQLVDGGILVAPVGGEREQTIVRVTRTGDKTKEKYMLACRFVKLIGDHAWPES